MHPVQDSSLHMTLPATVKKLVTEAGWGVPHPIQNTQLVYGPAIATRSRWCGGSCCAPTTTRGEARWTTRLPPHLPVGKRGGERVGVSPNPREAARYPVDVHAGPGRPRGGTTRVGPSAAFAPVAQHRRRGFSVGFRRWVHRSG
ncbi:hypothetical protein CDG81_21350 [Actinopolyspora erythraea]|uniref:Luciferase domain-containing protein n=1 Tax=Actinopolyspora erythraea TaxID=414996 RepID=A0A223RWZ5_9ACTN|nr:hypothetical protein CDG81_21350 [Actinopolyspora erythraea]